MQFIGFNWCKKLTSEFEIKAHRNIAGTRTGEKVARFFQSHEDAPNFDIAAALERNPVVHIATNRKSREIVGVSISRIFLGKPKLEIALVDQNARKLGIGIELFRSAISWARAKGHDRALVPVMNERLKFKLTAAGIPAKSNIGDTTTFEIPTSVVDSEKLIKKLEEHT